MTFPTFNGKDFEWAIYNAVKSSKYSTTMLEAFCCNEVRKQLDALYIFDSPFSNVQLQATIDKAVRDVGRLCSLKASIYDFTEASI